MQKKFTIYLIEELNRFVLPSLGDLKLKFVWTVPIDTVGE